MKKKILFKDDIIKDGKYFIVNQDWEVPISGFFIIAPKRKLRSISEFTDDESVEFMILLRQTRKGMEEVLGIEDVYLFQHEDANSDFHLWMFPRHEWMEKFGRKITSVKPIMNYAEENMVSDDIIREVKKDVEKMRMYMDKLSNNILT